MSEYLQNFIDIELKDGKKPEISFSKEDKMLQISKSRENDFFSVTLVLKENVKYYY